MEQTLKQRLVGAIVLISLGVIFIPIILEGPDDEWSPRVQEIPAPPRIDYQAQVEVPIPAEIPEPAEVAPSPVVDTITPSETTIVPEEPDEVTAAAEPAIEKTTVQAVKPAPVPAPKIQAKPEPKPKPKPKPSVSTGGWVVQVGSFSQTLNARGLRDRLRKSGYKAFVQETTSGGRRIYRVLLGPVGNRAEAEKLRDDVGRKHRLKGIVVENAG